MARNQARWGAGDRPVFPWEKDGELHYSRLDDPEFARTAFDASPLASVDTWKSPVLLGCYGRRSAVAIE